MKVYLSGPISGLDLTHARVNFRLAAAALSDAGLEPVNPMNEVPTQPDWSWSDYIRADLRLLLDCDGVALMDGWQASPGARLEAEVGTAIGAIVAPVGAWVRLVGER